MKVLVVGSGGREHAIIKKIKENKNVETIYAYPGNGGMKDDAVLVAGSATDIEGVVSFSKENKVDYVVVTPDDPLVLGMVDALEAEDIPCFGPKKNAAIIEGSKVFSKNLMKKYGIPTAAYEVFDDVNKALKYVETCPIPTVVKADGLALGKGVVIAMSREEAKEAVISAMSDHRFGASGDHIVIEEFLEGPEVSVLAFTDGKTLKPMVSSMDHKRALDNDEGLNTGGMGTIAPNPLYTKAYADECMEKIFIPTIEAMQKEGRPFKGCLYFGLMLTPDGAKVVEYNCRFGDPEAQVVLPLLKTDLVDIIEAIWEEKLDKLDIEWHSGACACVVMASGGYPQKYETGKPISGFNADGQPDSGKAYVYHAGTKLENGTFLTAGGRVLGVTATADDLQTALDKAYEAVSEINFDGAHFRRDIGHSALGIK